MNELTIGFASIGILVIIQIGLFAYGYGKLSQMVTNNTKRIDSNSNRLERTEARVTSLEITGGGRK